VSQNLPPSLLAIAVEEYIRMGPERARSDEDRIADRAPEYDAATRQAALVEAQRVVRSAEALAADYVAGTRSQADAEAALRRLHPWFDALRDRGDLAKRVGSYGYYLAIK
jgi:hypothetical protein